MKKIALDHSLLKQVVQWETTLRCLSLPSLPRNLEFIFGAMVVSLLADKNIVTGLDLKRFIHSSRMSRTR